MCLFTLYVNFELPRWPYNVKSLPLTVTFIINSLFVHTQFEYKHIKYSTSRWFAYHNVTIQSRISHLSKHVENMFINILESRNWICNS